MPDFLFYGDTERSHAMRHELPLAIGDPFTMAIVDGQLHIEVNSLERDRVEATAPHAVLHDINDLGFSELRQRGMRSQEIRGELASRLVWGTGIGGATPAR